MGRRKQEHNGYFISFDLRQGHICKCFTLYISATTKDKVREELSCKIKKLSFYNEIKKKGKVELIVFSIVRA